MLIIHQLDQHSTNLDYRGASAVGSTTHTFLVDGSLLIVEATPSNFIGTPNIAGGGSIFSMHMNDARCAAIEVHTIFPR